MTSPAPLPVNLPRRLATGLRNLASARSNELAGAVARREAARFLAGTRSRPGLAAAMAAAAGLALLIPLHRAYGHASAGFRDAYFPMFVIAIQLSLLVLSMRAVWLSHRQDIATGTLDELVLAGITGPQALLGRWAGLCLAGLYWVAMLLPALMLAGAVTGHEPVVLARVWVAWLITAWGGGMLGTIMTLSERGSAGALTFFPLAFQGWFMSYTLLPRMLSGMHEFWQNLVRTLHALDPMAIVMAAIAPRWGNWGIKAAVALALLGMMAVWVSGWAGELNGVAQKRPKPSGGAMMTLRPVREWVMRRLDREAPDYRRAVMLPFERAFGWRLRVTTPAWVVMLGIGFIPSLPAAILGREGNITAIVLAVADLCVAGVIAGFGMAASLAGEREQGRWIFLRCSPLSVAEIVLGKWLAVWLETWPIWALALIRAVLLTIGGAMPLGGALIAVLAPPILAGAVAAFVALLCARAQTLTAAQQRAALLLFAPPVLALIAQLLLPELVWLRNLCPPQLVVLALQFDYDAPLGAFAVALAGYAAAAALALLGAAWQVRREEG